MDIKHYIHVYVYIKESGRNFPLLVVNTLLLKEPIKETQKFFAIVRDTESLLHLAFLRQ